MKKVTLRSVVEYRNNVHKAGTSLDVPNEQAETWAKAGVLHEGSGPSEQQRTRRSMDRRAARAQGGGYRADDDDEGGATQREYAFLPVTPKQYDALKEAGYDTPDALASASDEDLAKVEGLDGVTIQRLRELMGGGTASVAPPSEVPVRSTRGARR